MYSLRAGSLRRVKVVCGVEVSAAHGELSVRDGRSEERRVGKECRL